MGAPPGRLQQRPGARDVGLERRQGVVVGHLHLCLGREVEHRAHLVLPQEALEQGLVGDVALHDGDLAQPSRDDVGRSDQVTTKDHHRSASVHEQPAQV
jgi:hypothetical protein